MDTLQERLDAVIRRRYLVMPLAPEYQHTLKLMTTPGGRRYLKVTASGRRTSGNHWGWPTPVAHEDNRSPEAYRARKRRMGERDGSGAGRRAITSLQVLAKTLAGWTTPQAHDASPRGKGQKAKHGTKHGCADLNPDGSTRHRVDQSPRQAAQAGWATPTVNEATGGQSAYPGGDHTKKVLKLPGQAQSGTPAGTEKRGASRLNPRFSLWLMGYPPQWADCGSRYSKPSRRR